MNTFGLFMFVAGTAVVMGCSTHNECALDQCCGFMSLDLLGLAQSCRPYSKLGEGCHGDLLRSNCDCEDGLVCVEYSFLTAPLHTSKGYCAKPTDSDGGFLSSLVG